MGRLLRWCALALACVGIGCGDAGGDDDGGRVVLRIQDVCPDSLDDDLGPLPFEFGHWAAGRLGPYDQDYSVTAVTYAIAGGFFLGGGEVRCVTSLDHRVQVFVGESETPPPTPDVLYEFATSAIPDPPSGENLELITYPLQPPLRLESGESLFISVALAGEAGRAICIDVCGDTPSELFDRGWWSNTDECEGGSCEPPYPWYQVGPVGLPFAYEMTATATPVR